MQLHRVGALGVPLEQPRQGGPGGIVGVVIFIRGNRRGWGVELTACGAGGVLEPEPP